VGLLIAVLVSWSMGWPNVRLVSQWFIGGLVGLLIGWSVSRSVCLSVVHVVVYFAWSGDHSFGHLVGW